MTYEIEQDPDRPWDEAPYICGVPVRDKDWDGEDVSHGCTRPKGHEPADVHCCPEVAE